MQTQPGSWRRDTSTQPQTQEDVLLLCSQLLPQGLSLTFVNYPLHPSRLIQNTSALALRPNMQLTPNFSYSAAVVLLHLQGQTSGSPERLSSKYLCTTLGNFSSCAVSLSHKAHGLAFKRTEARCKICR